MPSDQIEAAVEGYRTFVRVAVEYVDGSVDPETATRRFERLLTSCVMLRYRSIEASGPEAAGHHRATAYFSRGLETKPGRIEPLLAFILFMPLSSIVQDGSRRALGLIENWLLDRRLARVVEILGYHEGSQEELRGLMRILFDHHAWLNGVPSGPECARAFLEILGVPEIGQYLQVHKYDGTVWFNREARWPW